MTPPKASQQGDESTLVRLVMAAGMGVLWAATTISVSIAAIVALAVLDAVFGSNGASIVHDWVHMLVVGVCFGSAQAGLLRLRSINRDLMDCVVWTVLTTLAAGFGIVLEHVIVGEKLDLSLRYVFNLNVLVPFLAVSLVQGLILHRRIAGAMRWPLSNLVAAAFIFNHEALSAPPLIVLCLLTVGTALPAAWMFCSGYIVPRNSTPSGPESVAVTSPDRRHSTRRLLQRMGVPLLAAVLVSIGTVAVLRHTLSMAREVIACEELAAVTVPDTWESLAVHMNGRVEDLPHQRLGSLELRVELVDRRPFVDRITIMSPQACQSLTIPPPDGVRGGDGVCARKGEVTLFAFGPDACKLRPTHAIRQHMVTVPSPARSTAIFASVACVLSVLVALAGVIAANRVVRSPGDGRFQQDSDCRSDEWPHLCTISSVLLIMQGVLMAVSS